MRLEVESASEATLTVLESTNLVSWSEVGRAKRGANGQWEFTDVEASRHAQRFYRVVLP